MKGCVQGYGNYNELTSSGVDPRELFDDIEENSGKLSDLITPNIVLEERDDVGEEDQQEIKGLDDMHLISVEKARRNVRVKHSEDDLVLFNHLHDGGSLCTTPSMLSLISMPSKSEDNVRVKMVSVSL